MLWELKKHYDAYNTVLFIVIHCDKIYMKFFT